MSCGDDFAKYKKLNQRIETSLPGGAASSSQNLADDIPVHVG
jgi:hypothetical protein